MDSMNEVTESLKQFALREKDGSGLSEGVDSLDQRTSENPPDVTESTVHATPSRSSGKPKLSSVSQSHVQTGSLGSYSAEDMAIPISVNLERTQQCEATKMIKFLLAFCRSGNDKTVPVHDEKVLQDVFKETKKLANCSGTPLRKSLQEFLNAGDEFEMYKQFVLACNYALDKLSEIKVQILPPFEPTKQIVFVHSSNKSPDPTTHWRDPQVRPGIVLLQWNLSKERLSTSTFNGSTINYSKSHTEGLCVSNSSLDLSWRDIRSTVEMKIEGPPRPVEVPAVFDGDFCTLKETAPHTPRVDDIQPTLIPRVLPMRKYDSRSSDGQSNEKPPVTAENVGIHSSYKRRLEAAARDCDRELPSRRAKDESHRNIPPGGEGSRKGAAESSEVKVMGVSQKDPVNIQNGIYAAKRLSCSLDVTHSINFILLGSTIYITWSDRQNVIQTSGFDVVNDLPHFLLVLLVLQRFDLARWGFFTKFPESSIQTIGSIHQTHILRATFTDGPIDIYPEDHPIYGGIKLLGRSTCVAGAKKGGDQPPSMTNSEDIRKAADLIAKFSWPEESRVSEVTFIQRAEEIGKTNDLVKGHIPMILGNIDPPYLTCSTSLIRQFLDLDVSGARVLRVIVFRRLEEIEYLDEEDMVIAWLDCFFCHWALWEKHIEHGDISLGNLMYDPMTKRGVLSDFDLAREGGQNRRPSAKDNTGTLPFLALDLLNKRASEGLVPRRYRQDAESFAWCLIYICICVGKDERGRIGTINPHPLLPWFETIATSFASKVTLRRGQLLEEFPLHKRAKPLALALHDYWVARFNSQMMSLGGSVNPENIASELMDWFQPKETTQTTELYTEPLDHESFVKAFTAILSMLKRNPGIPKTKVDILRESVKALITWYPYVASTVKIV